MGKTAADLRRRRRVLVTTRLRAHSVEFVDGSGGGDAFDAGHLRLLHARDRRLSAARQRGRERRPMAPRQFNVRVRGVLKKNTLVERI